MNPRCAFDELPSRRCTALVPQQLPGETLLMDEARQLEWIEREGPLCVSVLSGSTNAASVLDPATLSFPAAGAAEAWAFQGPDYNRNWFAVGEIGDLTFVWESNGWRGADPELAATLSASGLFVSVYWNVNSLMTFTYARAGQIVVQFDPLWPPSTDIWDTLIAAGATQCTDEEWETSRESSALIVQSEITGAHIADPSWLDRPDVTFWGSTF